MKWNNRKYQFWMFKLESEAKRNQKWKKKISFSPEQKDRIQPFFLLLQFAIFSHWKRHNFSVFFPLFHYIFFAKIWQTRSLWSFSNNILTVSSSWWYFRFHNHISFINYKLWLFFSSFHSSFDACVFFSELHWKRNLLMGMVFPLQNDPFESFNKKYVCILPEIGKTNQKKNKYFIESTTFHKVIFLLHIVYTEKGSKKWMNFWIRGAVD